MRNAVFNTKSVIQVTVCERSGSPCETDDDSPQGPGTTTCKQAYKIQKMLAVDETGARDIARLNQSPKEGGK